MFFIQGSEFTRSVNKRVVVHAILSVARDGNPKLLRWLLGLP